MSGLGLSEATRKVADHARSLVELEVQLAVAEMKRKALSLGIGIGLALGAAFVATLALCFALAAGAAALSLVMTVWEACLVMFGLLILAALVLASIGIILLKRGAPPLPEEALDEARITREALRDEL